MIYDLIIIGGGPAGMTAGIYASRLNLKTLLITKTFGGQVSNKAVAIENYTGFESVQGPELVKKMENHLKSLEIDVEMAEVTGLRRQEDFIVSTQGQDYQAKTVILATGSEYKHLNVPGEKEFLGKGVSHCSVCDGPLFKNKKVAIVGGGNAGFETAAFLTNVAERIYILEFSEEAKAFPHIQESVLKSGKVEVITEAKIKEIKGDRFVNSIVFNHKNKEETLEVQGVFIEVGYKPSTSFLNNLISLNRNGEAEVEFETMQTELAGLFAAGDVNNGQFKQIITAAGEGAKAALAAHNFIKHKKVEK